MRNIRSFDEATARAVLESAQQRAAKINLTTQTPVNVFALRPETFIAILKASPGLIRWERLRGQLEHAPMYSVDGDDWRIVITDASMESQGFRAKVVSFQGSYLADPVPSTRRLDGVSA
jgi:hypothetical protein